MAICHGQPTGQPVGGCCYLDGAICPHFKRGAELPAYIDSLGLKGAAKNRATAQAQGVSCACDIALRIIANDAAMLGNRAAFNSAWDTHPEYVRDVRPAWVVVEQRLGLAAGSYQCSTWGPGIGQCCFGEGQVANEGKAKNLHADAVQVRRAGGE